MGYTAYALCETLASRSSLAALSWQPQQSGQFAALMFIPVANESRDMLGSLNAAHRTVARTEDRGPSTEYQVRVRV